MKPIKEAVKAVLDNALNYNLVDVYSRHAFNKWFAKNPHKKSDGGFIGYVNYEVLDENIIKINYIYGAYEIEFNGELFVDIRTKEITEKHEI